MQKDTSIWSQRGGTGRRTILLLHGLGATGAVWSGVQRALDENSLGEWIAPDLSGHGLSDWRSDYSVGGLAAELVPVLRETQELFVIGHSLGAYVALALASGWFGVRVRGVLGIGPKIAWSDAELQGTRELAARPVRWYAQEAEAAARYRRMSGLEGTVTAELDALARGTTQAQQGFRLAQDPRTFMVAGASFATLAASATAPLVLARGEHDRMVTLDQLRSHCKDAHDIGGAGHNVHVENPAAVIKLLAPLLA